MTQAPVRLLDLERPLPPGMETPAPRRAVAQRAKLLLAPWRRRAANEWDAGAFPRIRSIVELSLLRLQILGLIIVQLHSGTGFSPTVKQHRQRTCHSSLSLPSQGYRLDLKSACDRRKQLSS